MNAERALGIRALRKSYGGVPALRDFDLEILRGEFVALLGPNGAGKSTLFQMLAGLFVADGGDIAICGIDLARHPAAALARLGIVFQQPTLDLDLSVRDNLRFHARLHGLGRGAAARIDDALAQFGLAAVAGRACRTLSGGNRRKVELARALLHAPDLLLMDEATVGLDPASRGALLEQVRALCAQRGVAVLWATHLVDEAVDAGRVVVLHHGLRLVDGAPAELLRTHGASDLQALFLRLTGGDANAVERAA